MKTAAATITHDNNQDPTTSRQSSAPTAINQEDGGFFIPSMTTDPCMTSDHHQIQYIKQFLGTSLTSLLYLSYALLSTIYHNPFIYDCCILSQIKIVNLNL